MDDSTPVCLLHRACSLLLAAPIVRVAHLHSAIHSICLLLDPSLNTSGRREFPLQRVALNDILILFRLFNREIHRLGYLRRLLLLLLRCFVVVSREFLSHLLDSLLSVFDARPDARLHGSSELTMLFRSHSCDRFVTSRRNDNVVRLSSIRILASFSS